MVDNGLKQMLYLNACRDKSTLTDVTEDTSCMFWVAEIITALNPKKTTAEKVDTAIS